MRELTNVQYKRTKISALVVENTFMTLPSLIPTVLPVAAPLSFLCHQVWDSASAARSLPVELPVLLLSGSEDELVPPSQMLGLFHILSGTAGKSAEADTESKANADETAPHIANGRLLIFKKFTNGHHSEFYNMSPTQQI